MPNKVLVGGTVYKIDGSKDLVAGTVIKRDHSEVMIGGTVYIIPLTCEIVASVYGKYASPDVYYVDPSAGIVSIYRDGDYVIPAGSRFGVRTGSSDYQTNIYRNGVVVDSNWGVSSYEFVPERSFTVKIEQDSHYADQIYIDDI